MRELKSGMPQLDPCCFPLLHPRGTLGFRWFMKKNGMQRELTDEEKRMQEELDKANKQEMKDLNYLEPSVQDNSMGDQNDDNITDEEENDLDQDEPNTDDMNMNEAEAHLEPSVPDDATNDHGDEAEMDEAQYNFDMNLTSNVEENKDDAEQQMDSESVDVVAPNDNVLDPDATQFHGKTSKSCISERQFYRYRLAMRTNKKGTFHWLW